jgi:hypothetical protein
VFILRREDRGQATSKKIKKMKYGCMSFFSLPDGYALGQVHMVISVLLLNDSATQVRMFLSNTTFFFLFTTAANVQVAGNFYSPPVSEQEFYFCQHEKSWIFFMNPLMYLTVQCCTRGRPQRIPYGSDNM